MASPSARPAPTGTRGLVAPELLPGLDLVPDFQLSAESLPLMREAMGKFVRPPLTPALEAVRCEQKFVPGVTGSPDVRVLVYTPPGSSAQPRPAYFHMHGGGYIIGTPEISDASNRAMAIEHGCVVVSVDYRLAPETPFPGSRDDCYAALKWLHAEADRLGVDRARIAIGGESAGGGHAATLALYAVARGEVPICFQLLDSPMLDDRTGTTADPHPYCGEFVWTPAKNRFGWQALLGMEPGGPNVPVDAVPARAKTLSGLPPTFINVGALDLFVEENLEYARRLIRAGVPTEVHVIPGAYHGHGAAQNAPQVQTQTHLRREALARAFR